MDSKEFINFIYFLSNSAIVTNGTNWLLDLTTVINNFGYNYNGIVIKNMHTDDGLFLQFDGLTSKRIPLPKNGGSFVLSYDDKLVYNQVEIVNASGSDVAIGDLNISIIRAGF